MTATARATVRESLEQTIATKDALLEERTLYYRERAASRSYSALNLAGRMVYPSTP